MKKLLLALSLFSFSTLSFANNQFSTAVNYIVENTPHPQKYHEQMIEFTKERYQDYFKKNLKLSMDFTEDEEKEVAEFTKFFMKKQKKSVL